VLGGLVVGLKVLHRVGHHLFQLLQLRQSCVTPPRNTSPESVRYHSITAMTQRFHVSGPAVSCFTGAA
jgi:hypothetical protein